MEVVWGQIFWAGFISMGENGHIDGNGVNYRWLAQRLTTALIGIVGFWASAISYAVWTNTKAIAVLLEDIEKVTPIL